MKRIILVAITLALLVAVVFAGVTFSEQRQLDEMSRANRVKKAYYIWWRGPYWGYGWRRPYWGYWG
uniref:TcH SLdT.460 protein n=1 Tax=Toxocara canis TaxID=6265 RepID=P91816_TOXCA|nr:TcH SLdT.460 [Toxocara canis]